MFHSLCLTNHPAKTASEDLITLSHVPSLMKEEMDVKKKE